MKQCLRCQKDFEEKRETAKFCSTSCRVMHHRLHGKTKGVTPVQMQVLYNAMMGAVEVINKFSEELPKDFQKIKGVGILNENGDVEPLSFDKLKQEANKPTYMQLLHGMANIHFPDEKEEYILKIIAADHLPQKQIDSLISNLKMKQ